MKQLTDQRDIKAQQLWHHSPQLNSELGKFDSLPILKNLLILIRNNIVTCLWLRD
jgi:hypothetical protein